MRLNLEVGDFEVFHTNEVGKTERVIEAYPCSLLLTGPRLGGRGIKPMFLHGTGRRNIQIFEASLAHALERRAHRGKTTQSEKGEGKGTPHRTKAHLLRTSYSSSSSPAVTPPL